MSCGCHAVGTCCVEVVTYNWRESWGLLQGCFKQRPLSPLQLSDLAVSRISKC